MAASTTPQAAANAGRRLTVVLLVLTAATGLIDGISFLGMGNVLVANMTGNVVFLGFALVGAHGMTVTPFLVALAAFVAGAGLGGRLWTGLGMGPGTDTGARRRRWLVIASGTQLVLAAVAAVVAAVIPVGATGTNRLWIIALLGVGTGIQNATVRRLAVPDVTTTVLTMTITGLAADSAADSRRSMRLASVATMLAGAVVGGALVPHAGVAVALTVLTVALAVVTAGFATLPSHDS